MDRNRQQQVDRAVSRIVVVGGGTAGWLTACSIAARANPKASPPLEVCLIESPDITTVGVGEGTWPTMRQTLARIGISESEFLIATGASFKQGSRFDGWSTGEPGDTYYHPFVPPVGGPEEAIAAWQAAEAGSPFADAVSPQPAICRLDLAPRQRSMRDYSGALNYAYHFDAGRLAELLSRHATSRLGVRHISDHVVSVQDDETGGIRSVSTRQHGAIEGELFIDCSGHAALLIGGHFGVPFVDKGDQLFNDRALVAQVPIAPGSPIASQTVGTAHEAGWLWDITLHERRGIGCVYSSRHMTDDAAEVVLRDYLRKTGDTVGDRSFRRLTFRSGHRERFWERNCLAIGLSAGFLEPLEASAIVLIELSLDALLDNFPKSSSAMAFHAARFNALFEYRWGRIVDFLKLHYVLSRRDEPYWRDNRDTASISPRLRDLIALWDDQPPSDWDFPAANEVFPAASYQYVLYGMGRPAPAPGPMLRASPAQAGAAAVADRGRALAAALPTNRAYLDALHDVRASTSPLQEMN